MRDRDVARGGCRRSRGRRHLEREMEEGNEQCENHDSSWAKSSRGDSSGNRGGRKGEKERARMLEESGTGGQGRFKEGKQVCD